MDGDRDDVDGGSKQVRHSAKVEYRVERSTMGRLWVETCNVWIISNYVRMCVWTGCTYVENKTTMLRHSLWIFSPSLTRIELRTRRFFVVDQPPYHRNRLQHRLQHKLQHNLL